MKSRADPSREKLRDAIRRVVEPGLDARWGQRLTERALARASSPLCAPPLMAWRLVVELGARPRDAMRWLLACSLFYGAADLLDDADDGDLAPDVCVTARADAVGLLFACQSVTSSFRPTEIAARLSSIFAREGQRMALGQANDLSLSGRVADFDLASISRDKAGAEIAALFAGAAVVARRPHHRFERFGRALGTLLQVLSDREDALGPDSRDFRDAKPTLVLRPVGASEEELLLAHAGDRRDPARAARMRRWALRADNAARFDALADSLLSALAAPITGRVPAHLVALAVAAAQAVSTARSPPPARRSRSEARDVDQAIAAAEDFVRADPTLEEATEVCRHGLFGAASVRGDLFGRLFAESILHDVGVELREVAEAALARGDVDGWRYYPGRSEIPPDADDTGLALQLAARAGLRDDPRMIAGAESIVACQRPDGIIPTWLVRPREAREAAVKRWVDAACPVASAQALLGLWRFAGAAHRSCVERGARALAEQMAERDAPRSDFYAPVLVDAISGAILAALTSELGIEEDPVARSARARTRARLIARRDIGSRFGSVVETSLAARALWLTGGLTAPRAVVETLVDAQRADGGYAAEPFFQTVPHPVTTHHGARTITTAAALAAMKLLRAKMGRSERDAAPESYGTLQFSP